jgi:hypothetical protein
MQADDPQGPLAANVIIKSVNGSGGLVEARPRGALFDRTYVSTLWRTIDLGH